MLEAESGPVDDVELERRIKLAVQQWHDVLGRQVVVARQIVRKLIDGKITFTPEERDGRKGFRFKAIGTLTPFLEGVIPGAAARLQVMASPTGTISPWIAEFVGTTGCCRV